MNMNAIQAKVESFIKQLNKDIGLNEENRLDLDNTLTNTITQQINSKLASNFEYADVEIKTKQGIKTSSSILNNSDIRDYIINKKLESNFAGGLASFLKTVDIGLTVDDCGELHTRTDIITNQYFKKFRMNYSLLSEIKTSKPIFYSYNLVKRVKEYMTNFENSPASSEIKDLYIYLAENTSSVEVLGKECWNDDMLFKHIIDYITITCNEHRNIEGLIRKQNILNNTNIYDVIDFLIDENAIKNLGLNSTLVGMISLSREHKALNEIYDNVYMQADLRRELLTGRELNEIIEEYNEYKELYEAYSEDGIGGLILRLMENSLNN